MFWKCEDGSIESFQLESNARYDTIETHVYNNARIWHGDPPVIFSMSKSNNGMKLIIRVGVDGREYVICEKEYDVRRLISWLIKTYKDLFGR